MLISHRSLDFFVYLKEYGNNIFFIRAILQNFHTSTLNTKYWFTSPWINLCSTLHFTSLKKSIFIAKICQSLTHLTKSWQFFLLLKIQFCHMIINHSVWSKISTFHGCVEYVALVKAFHHYWQLSNEVCIKFFKTTSS